MNDVLLSLYKPVSDDNAEDIHSFHFDNVASALHAEQYFAGKIWDSWTLLRNPNASVGEGFVSIEFPTTMRKISIAFILIMLQVRENGLSSSSTVPSRRS
jgi:hypothetical protein